MSDSITNKMEQGKFSDTDFIMSPKVDFCFKELMQEPGIRKGFIAALLDVEPESIQQTIVLDTNLERRSEADKLGILDVLVEMEDHTRIDLEMQVAYFEYWTNRILYYLCRMYTGQLKKGQSYEELKSCYKTVSIKGAEKLDKYIQLSAL